MDSRFRLKVEFRIYGKVFPWECSLNWSAEEGEIDPRIKEFFVVAHGEAYQEYREANEKKLAESEEAQEFKDFLRLKAKYESTRPQPTKEET